MKKSEKPCTVKKGLWEITIEKDLITYFLQELGRPLTTKEKYFIQWMVDKEAQYYLTKTEKTRQYGEAEGTRLFLK
jgi:hypothetical protein